MGRTCAGSKVAEPVAGLGGREAVEEVEGVQVGRVLGADDQVHVVGGIAIDLIDFRLGPQLQPLASTTGSVIPLLDAVVPSLSATPSLRQDLGLQISRCRFHLTSAQNIWLANFRRSHLVRFVDRFSFGAKTAT
jgi:hypothetical protein